MNCTPFLAQAVNCTPFSGQTREKGVFNMRYSYDFKVVCGNATKKQIDVTPKYVGKAFEKETNNEGGVFYLDQGWQYQHMTYRSLLDGHSIRQSMSRKEN